MNQRAAEDFVVDVVVHKYDFNEIVHIMRTHTVLNSKKVILKVAFFYYSLQWSDCFLDNNEFPIVTKLKNIVTFYRLIRI